MKTCEINGGKLSGKNKGEESPSQSQIDKLKEIMVSLPDENRLQAQSELFKPLSDPTRLKILYLLRNGELCVCEIIFALKKPQSTISHHLNILKKAGFIKGRKEGVWIHYRLTDAEIVEVIDNLTSILNEKGGF
jgi:DNA-binding transcriptional ArsR family regulator